MVWTNPLALAVRGHDPSWYFNNAISYNIFYDINDFNNLHDLQPCTSSQDDITLAYGSVILSEGIGKVWFNFKVNGQPNQIFLLGIRYCTKLDIKLISLGMLDKKDFTYSMQQGFFTIKDWDVIVIKRQLNRHNLYHVNLSIL